MSDEDEGDGRASIEAKAAQLVTIKKVGTWIVGTAAVVAALAGLGSQLGGWMKAGLGIDHLEQRVGHLESQVARLETRVAARESRPDANARLTEALPRVASALREGRKDRQRLTHAATRLATIHEFGLDRRRARETAREVQRDMRTEEPGSAGAPGTDELAGLEGL